MIQRRRFAAYYPNGMRRWFPTLREAIAFVYAPLIVRYVQSQTERMALLRDSFGCYRPELRVVGRRYVSPVNCE